jgi:diacylglycerol O-acyltransferase
MLGCPMEAVYPVDPLVNSHAVSVGMTTVRDRACFGVYADPEALPDADRLARGIEEALGELLARSSRGRDAPAR